MTIAEMGASSVKLFDDDLAADVRAEWREAVMDGDRTQRVLDAFAGVLEEDVFWLALALAQHETGRLEDDVRDKALAVVERGGDVDEWESEAGLGKQRERELARLAKKLKGPQPKPKTPRRPRVKPVPFEIGDAVRMHNNLTVVVGMREAWPPGQLQPVFVQLVWPGWEAGVVPPADEIARLPLLLVSYGRGESGPSFFAVATEFDPVPEWVETVARGVHRPEAADWRARDGSIREVDSGRWLAYERYMRKPYWDLCIEDQKPPLP